MTKNRTGKTWRDNPAPSTHRANVLSETLEPERNSRVPQRTPSRSSTKTPAQIKANYVALMGPQAGEAFAEYVAGIAPKAIARGLNRDGVAGPFGGTWSPSTIHGNAKRGTGILNNEMYVGRMIWNRLRYVKNPDTGKRISRLNPKAEWITGRSRPSG